MLSPAVAQALDAAALFLILSFTFSAAAAAVPVRKDDAARLERTTRYRLFIPPVAALFVVALGFMSAAFDAWDKLPDHCGDTHVHEATLCYLHPTNIAGLYLDEVATMLVGGALLALMACRALQLYLAARHVAGLAQASDVRLAMALRVKLATWSLAWPGVIVVVRDRRPICFTTGVWTPQLVISTGTLADLADIDLKAVVAHELAHLARKDGAWRIAGSLVSLTQVPILGRRALVAWLAASEAACDEAAAERIGSRVAVARAIVKYQRLLNASLRPAGVQPAVAPAFAGVGALEARIRQLLGPGSTNSDLLVRHWPWLAALVAVWQVDVIHVGLEWLLRLIHA